jgi:hypothetical protein
MKKLGKFVTMCSAGALVGAGLYYWRKMTNVPQEDGERIQRLHCYYDITARWVENNQDGLKIGDYLNEKGIHKIGIYGNGRIGIMLYKELKDSDIAVEYFVDKEALEDHPTIDGVVVTSPDRVAVSAETDAIIVTPVFAMEEIEKVLRKSGYKKDILSLTICLYEM